MVYTRGWYWSRYCFDIYIIDLFDGIKCTLNKFAGDTKLREVVDSPDGCAAIQSKLSRLEK